MSSYTPYFGSTLGAVSDNINGVDYSLVYGGPGYASDYLHYVRTSSLQPVSASIPPPAAVAASTGTNPTETAYALYGHPVPLSVFGVGRIGGEIIAGPWVANGMASFIISFGVPADPSGTRTLREIAFDSEVVWDSTNGFSTETFTYRFYGGTLTQAADSLETSHFGGDAIAYRPQMLLAFENLPLSATKFGKIPYVAAVIADATGDDVNLGEAFERLAYSPWVGWTSDQFETSGITDGLVSGGIIIAQDAEFLATIQQFGRFYPRWDILQTDKLRIIDRGATVTADILLDKSRLMDAVTIARQGPDTVKKDLELSTIDPDADYTIVPSVAQRPRDPVAVTTSVGKETAYLPAIMNSQTRMAIVTFTKYHEEVGRKIINATAMAYGLEIEPGALVEIHNLDDTFRRETFRVLETLHGANCVVEFTAQAILKCQIPDPYWDSVVLLMGFEGANGSKSVPGLTDESSHLHGTADSTNSSAIDTSQYKFGSSSLLITGFSPAVIFEPHSDWRLSTSNSDQFTIECWVRLPTAIGELACIVGSSDISEIWDFSILPGGEFRFAFYNSASVGIAVNSTGASITTDTWYHLAVDKDASGKIRVYKDGVMLGSDTPADSSILFDSGASLDIGALGLFGSLPFSGWVDELRITKGVARYASDGGFSAPTSAFPRP